MRRMQRLIAAKKRSKNAAKEPTHQDLVTHEDFGTHGDLDDLDDHNAANHSSDSERGYERLRSRNLRIMARVSELNMPKPNLALKPPKPPSKGLVPIDIRVGKLWLIVGPGTAPYDEATTLHV